MPIPDTKIFLSTALPAGTGYRFRPDGRGDFAVTVTGQPHAAWFTAIGDADGDGIEDFAISAPGDNDKAADAGRIFVQLSSHGFLTSGTLSALPGEIILDGVKAGDLSGAAIAAIADLNGDGLRELLIGAAGQDKTGIDAGVAFVVRGRATPGGIDLGDPLQGGKGYSLRGEAAGDAAGTSVLSIADLNGDGKEDVIVGAIGNDAGGADAGAVYVSWGKSTNSAVSLADVAAGTNGFRIVGADAGDAIGAHVATLDDLNGDGLAEIVIGAPDANGGDGAVFVVFGKATTTGIDLSDITNGAGGFRILGDALDGAGAAVTAIGDINGDGKADLLIGAPGSDSAYVVYAIDGSRDLSLADVGAGLGGFRILAESAGDLASLSLTCGRDLNRDGVADIVIGAAHNAEGGADAGAVYVIWGGANPGTVDLSLVAQSIGGAKIVGAAGSLTGEAVALVGDQNGDGTADLMIGAPGTGESAYVLFTPATWQPDHTVYGTNGADVIGPGYASLGNTVGAGPDNIVALAGNDTIDAGGGNDTLDGGTGADAMTGGAGDDTYWVDNAGDTTTETAGGSHDAVVASVDWTLSAQIEDLTLTGAARVGFGNALDNRLTGTAFADHLHGGAGNDTMIGGQGGDEYFVDDAGDVVTESAGGGIDTIVATLDWTLGAEIENLTLAGAALRATGNGLGNTLVGTAGNNTLDGAGGNDILRGLGGNDTYHVESALDQVVELLDEGTDTVIATVDYTLSANVERLELAGAARRGTGNALANRIVGTAGNDVLDGRAGADTMIGGEGDDTYLVDDAGDRVQELADQGNDSLIAAIDYDLGANPLTAHVEALILTGAAHRGTGNALNNLVRGGTGADTLDGAGGVDTLEGGAGDDHYRVDTTTDTLIELPGGGTDTVHSTVDFSLEPHTNIEHLALSGAARIGTGNALNNRLTGSTGSDTLSGLDGNDTLDGGEGADSMIGGLGDDTYYIDNAGDVVVELAGGGVDTVIVSSDWTLADNIENVRLVGAGHSLSGNDDDNTLNGDTGDDTLDGGDGDDTLIGGDGDDRLISRSGHDTLAGGAGDDVYEIHGGSVHIEDFQGRDCIDASEAEGDSHIDLSGETESEIEDQICDFGTGGTVTGALNVQFLQDLTGSFGDDIANVRTLVPQIVTALQSVQGGAAFGASTFRDKPISPYGSAGDWVYRTVAQMGTNTATLTMAYNAMLAGGGADGPEAQLEALLQVAARAETEVGFQTNAARVVVLFTDADFHTSAELPYGGMTRPNNGDATLDANENYPEVAQLAQALASANIIPIFAVAGGFEGAYQGLVGALGRGTVVSLTSDSSNIVAAITAGLTAATTTHISDVVGGRGNDTLIGNSGANDITGGAGDDSITCGLGDDSVSDGAGDDVVRLGDDDEDDDDYVRAGDGADEYHGGGGEDYISYYDATGGVNLDLATTLASGSWAEGDIVEGFEGASGSKTGNDILLGTGGANTLRGYGGDDRIEGRAGDDSLSGGDGDDTIDGSAGNDTISGGAGQDRVDDGAGDDIVKLGSGHDYVRAGGGADAYYGGSGTDYISYYDSSAGVSLDFAANTAARSWANNDIVDGFEGASGSKTGNDTLLGTDGANIFRGYGGDDRIDGRGGHDSLSGGDGNDTIDGGTGNDTISGGAGQDRVDDGAGNDIVTLGSGDDYVRAGGGADAYYGGSGTDYISYYDSSAGVTLDFAANTATGSWANNYIVDGFEGASGSKTGNDTLLGTDGANLFRGYGGDDWIDGRGGDDRIIGGTGNDTLTGGAGADHFVFKAGDGNDRVLDFDLGLDTL